MLESSTVEMSCSMKRSAKLRSQVCKKKALCGIQFSSDCDDDRPNEEETVTDRPTEPVLRRSKRERRPPDYYVEQSYIANDQLKEPATVEEALVSPDKAKWLNAMEKEMDSLHANDVWNLVELPEDRKAVGSKWVFKLKVGADGSVERHKAQFVAQGFSQKFGSDYDETFCLVVRLESLRTVIALAVQNGLKIHQVDVTTAFLNEELLEEVNMKQPKGFIVKGQEHLVCRLKRSIYGLKQSPRCWNYALDTKLKKMGFILTASDPCIYMSSEGEMFIIGVYVNDIVLAGKSDKKIEEVKKALAKQFDIKDMGKLHYFLCMKVIQNEETGEVWIGQPAYTESLLQKLGMCEACKSNRRRGLC